MSDEARLRAVRRSTHPYFHDKLKLYPENGTYYVNEETRNAYFRARKNLRSGIIRPGVNYRVEDTDFNPTNTIEMNRFEDFKIDTLFTFFIHYDTVSPGLWGSIIRQKSNKIFARLTSVNIKDPETIIIKYRLLGPGVTARPVSQKLLAAYNRINKEEYTMVLKKGYSSLEGVSGDQITAFEEKIRSTESSSNPRNFRAVRFHAIEKNSLSGGASKTRRNRKGKAKKGTRRHR